MAFKYQILSNNSLLQFRDLDERVFLFNSFVMSMLKFIFHWFIAWHKKIKIKIMTCTLLEQRDNNDRKLGWSNQPYPKQQNLICQNQKNIWFSFSVRKKQENIGSTLDCLQSGS